MKIRKNENGQSLQRMILFIESFANVNEGLKTEMLLINYPLKTLCFFISAHFHTVGFIYSFSHIYAGIRFV